MTPFAAIFVPAELRDAVSERAWFVGMLEAERALAAACAAVGLVSEEAAARIADVCRVDLYDPERLVRKGAPWAIRPSRSSARSATRPARGLPMPSTSARRARTSSTRRRCSSRTERPGSLLAELDRLADGCASLARAHRDAPIAARTLLQQAVPTTFGLKAAGWLTAVVEARRRLAVLRDERLAAQLGGAAGTLAAFGDHGLEVAALYARELGLGEPLVPWHTNRQRLAELGSALAAAAGAAAKVGFDLVLLAQTEVGEVAEASGGGSSTMPQKRNPVSSTLAVASARLAQAHAAVLIVGLVHEHERAVGAWHAEWEALSGSLAFAGGAVAAAADACPDSRSTWNACGATSRRATASSSPNASRSP